jgi:hypothetical protein
LEKSKKLKNKKTCKKNRKNIKGKEMKEEKSRGERKPKAVYLKLLAYGDKIYIYFFNKNVN